MQWERCRRDVAYWVNTFCKTYDPRLSEPLIPFRLFPRQVEFLRWIRDREQAQEDGLAEKSRDVGFTWLCCAYALHGWLFRTGFSAGFGSRKLELVDRIGDPDTIFEKIRILLRNLPAWMLPAGFRWSEHDNHCRLINPVTGSTITGEGGDNIGRGGRKTIYFVDEAAFLEHADKIEASLSATTRCRIWVSTPNGPGNPFARKRFGGKLPVFTFHWKDDPRKDEAWYHRQRETLNPVIVAQEIDIDYTASIEGICIPAAWVRSAVDYPLTPSTLTVAGLDVADEGVDRNVLVARRGPVVMMPVDWGHCNTVETAHRAREEARKLRVTYLNFDSIGVGAGVRGAFASSETLLPFRVQAVNVGEAPSGAVWEDGRCSTELFFNLKAEMWWTLRRRFEKTYENREGKANHPPGECISIPNHQQLIAELSMPLVHRTETGKIKLESKDEMRRRGVKSPDFADALVLSFVDKRGITAAPRSLGGGVAMPGRR